MQLHFEWDDDKAASNLRKHAISFDEAQTVFTDDFSLTLTDQEHSLAEERPIIIGISKRNRLLVVSYTERGKLIRLISARKATRMERKKYEEEDFA
jgi:uncharacterized DUF497 family protein